MPRKTGKIKEFWLSSWRVLGLLYPEQKGGCLIPIPSVPMLLSFVGLPQRARKDFPPAPVATGAGFLPSSEAWVLGILILPMLPMELKPRSS